MDASTVVGVVILALGLGAIALAKSPHVDD